MIRTEQAISERNYDAVSVPRLDDTRLGALSKAAARLTAAIN